MSGGGTSGKRGDKENPGSRTAKSVTNRGPHRGPFQTFLPLIMSPAMKTTISRRNSAPRLPRTIPMDAAILGITIPRLRLNALTPRITAMGAVLIMNSGRDSKAHDERKRWGILKSPGMLIAAEAALMPPAAKLTKASTRGPLAPLFEWFEVINGRLSFFLKVIGSSRPSIW